MHRRVGRALLFGLLLAASSTAQAAGVPTLDTVDVRAGADGLIGAADSATEGTISAKQLATRPLLRPGEMLEVVPGVIVTQHSSDGKANQYFLRGFNLDHGTDFLTTVNGMPVNQPTNAHGQGYADLNFLIPELVERVRYKKGPYSAEEGDFAAAGAAHLDYFRNLPRSFAEIGIGEDGWRRALLAGSPPAGGGTLLYGLEYYEYDGPWTVAQNFRRYNLVGRYSQGRADNGYSVTGMVYEATGRASNQVARRAIDSGAISRFGSLDPSDLMDTSRYSLSGQWAKSDSSGITRGNAYLMRSQLKLVSDFTYFLDFPAAGDQFAQEERRTTFGFDASHTWFGKWGAREGETIVGLQSRHDNIDPVGLYRSRGGVRADKLDADGNLQPAMVREDHVKQSSVGLYAQNSLQWLPWLRSVAGLRADFYRFDVSSSIAANSGKVNDHIVNPKLSLIFGPWAKTEFYLNAGGGFHSNDARGTTIRVDPNDTAIAADPVTPLVRAKGYEAGVRSAIVAGVQSTLSLWRLDLDSELLFIGDAGTTEASRPSRRSGIEFANYWHPVAGVIVDADLSWSRARFRDDNPAGNRIPGAIERVASVGVSLDRGEWFGGLRLRHFGRRPLIEDNSVHSGSSTLINLRAGYRINRSLQVSLDVLNLLDREVSDIEYFYESRLARETGPVSDIHLHPAEPRTLRLSLRASF
ncbi:MAG: TonB-dependent receptor [Sterolibacteriaceae bacterium]|nr:TonB-dependent receptor [Sterolibacteriaceae bacterium]